MSRRVSILMVVIWGLTGVPAFLHAQMVPPFVDDTESMSPALRETIEDLVERYEDLRTRLREQIRINETLFSREEVDRLLAELEEDLSLARQRIAELEDELVVANVARQDALDEAEAARARRDEAEEELQREVAVYQGVLENLEVERLLQAGPTFSPDGEIGAIALLNLPGTNLSLLGGVNYRLRERDFSTMFGATLSFFPQRNLVESWQRRRVQ